jgi:hypothetical protein
MNPSISNNIVVNPASTSLKPVTSIITSTIPDALPAETSSSIPSTFTPYPKLEPSAPVVVETSAITQSSEIRFKLKLLSILQNLLASDFSLIQNLIEITKNIILPVEDLYELIAILCDTKTIDIISQPVVKGCCSSASKLIYYDIERIVVNGFDLMIAYNNVYNTLKANNISLDHVIPSGIAE